MGSIATTIKQSKKLLALGLNPNTADMYYRDGGQDNFPFLEVRDTKLNEELLAWSLDALLNFGKKLYRVTDFNLIMCIDDQGWLIEYRGYDKEGNHHLIYESYGKTQIDAAYNMIKWVLENDYLKLD